MTQEKLETNWYTIKVQNNYENKVKERIEMEMGRNRSEYKIVIPMERTFSVKKGKKVSKDKVKYPGYLFVETQNVGELMNIVRLTTGATNVVTTTNGEGKKVPARLSKKEVYDMLIEDAEIKKPVSEDLYIVGQIVKILDGPFQDFSGAIEEVNLEKSTTKVGVKIFGKTTSVECSFEIIQKVS
jgi:transcriptional antiterminator NusG